MHIIFINNNIINGTGYLTVDNTTIRFRLITRPIVKLISVSISDYPFELA